MEIKIPQTINIEKKERKDYLFGTPLAGAIGLIILGLLMAALTDKLQFFWIIYIGIIILAILYNYNFKAKIKKITEKQITVLAEIGKWCNPTYEEIIRCPYLRNELIDKINFSLEKEEIGEKNDSN